jgi:glycosyltransferase involved in cell wall biosynthesis
LRITVVTYYLPPHDRIGAGVQMHMLANAYATLGHQVTLLSPSNHKDPDAQYTLCTVSIVGSNRIVKWSKALRQHKFDADVVHFAGDDHLVSTDNEYVHLRTFHGSCFAEALVASRVVDKLRMVYLGLMELIAQRSADVCTVVSLHTNRYFPRPNIVIPNGVDLESFSRSVSKSTVPSILFVGTLDSRKRGRELLNAFVNDIQPKFPNAELWLVRESGIVDNPGVKVFGSVSQEKLIELYQQAWVFCLPSSYEGFGVPYIESMACGTPVVATPNPGALEVLDNGKYGVVTQLESLGESLVALLSNEEERGKYIELGLTRSKDYDILKVAQRYIDLAMEYRERKSTK